MTIPQDCLEQVLFPQWTLLEVAAFSEDFEAICAVRDPEITRLCHRILFNTAHTASVNPGFATRFSNALEAAPNGDSNKQNEMATVIKRIALILNPSDPEGHELTAILREINTDSFNHRALIAASKWGTPENSIVPDLFYAMSNNQQYTLSNHHFQEHGACRHILSCLRADQRSYKQDWVRKLATTLTYDHSADLKQKITALEHPSTPLEQIGYASQIAIRIGNIYLANYLLNLAIKRTGPTQTKIQDLIDVLLYESIVFNRTALIAMFLEIPAHREPFQTGWANSSDPTTGHQHHRVNNTNHLTTQVTARPSKKGINYALVCATRQNQPGIVAIVLATQVAGGPSQQGIDRALEWAAYYNHQDILTSLLATQVAGGPSQQGIDTALLEAAFGNHQDIVTSLLTTQGAQRPSQRGIDLSLFKAALQTHQDIITTLLATQTAGGPSQQAIDEALRAATIRNHSGIVTSLLATQVAGGPSQKGIDLALSEAARKNHRLIVATLLATRVSGGPSQKGIDDALREAARENHEGIITSLLATQAAGGPSRQGIDEALVIAVRGNHSVIIDSLKEAKIPWWKKSFLSLGAAYRFPY